MCSVCSPAAEKGYRSSLVRAGYSRFPNMPFHLRGIVVRRMLSQRMLSQGTAAGVLPQAVLTAHAPVHTGLGALAFALRSLRPPNPPIRPLPPTPPQRPSAPHTRPPHPPTRTKPPLIPPPSLTPRHPLIRARYRGVSRTTPPTRAVPGRVLGMGRVTGLGLPGGLLGLPPRRGSRATAWLGLGVG